MDFLIKLTIQLSNKEFDQALDQVKKVNKKGLVREYIDLVNKLMDEGVTLSEATIKAGTKLLKD